MVTRRDLGPEVGAVGSLRAEGRQVSQLIDEVDKVHIKYVKVLREACS
jgi:hypothetical protein